MTIHRLTGCKEASMMLHKMNNAISYNDGQEETVRGKGTSHDTKRTIFQPLLKIAFLLI